MPIQERYIDSEGNLTGGSLNISPQNRAFRYGDGVFETILVRRGEAVAFGLHFSRLEFGLGSLWMETGYPHFRPKVEALVEKLLKDQALDGFGRMRITAYRADGGTYLPTDNRVQLVGEIIPLQGDPWTLRSPMRLQQGSAPPHGPFSHAKTMNAISYIVEARRAAANGFDDALLSHAGGISELTASNFFAVIDGRLYTPALTSGCLPGTMRARTILAAKKRGIEVVEGLIQSKDLWRASECFATNAIMGLQPIGSIEQVDYRPARFPILMQLRQKIEAMRDR